MHSLTYYLSRKQASNKQAHALHHSYLLRRSLHQLHTLLPQLLRGRVTLGSGGDGVGSAVEQVLARHPLHSRRGGGKDTGVGALQGGLLEEAHGGVQQGISRADDDVKGTSELSDDTTRVDGVDGDL